MIAYKIVDVDVTGALVLLHLAGGRRLSAPISRVPRLAEATPGQRTAWVLTDDGYGVNWPELTEPVPEGALSVWELEQDALYEQALAVLAAAHDDGSTIPRRIRELAALWRLEADIYKGGFLRFFCNWGDGGVRLAQTVLGEIGAPTTREILAAMREVLAPYAEVGGPATPGDLTARITQRDLARLDELDEQFWHDPDRLAERVVRHYGPVAAGGAQ